MSDEPAYIKDFKNFARTEIADSEFGENEKELYGLNDRATALMFAAALDNSLELLLRTVTRSDMNSKDKKAVFGSDKAIFRSFSSKIIAAYALKLIGPISKSDLNLIRLIRNEFAHSRKSFGFSNPETKAVCDHLKLVDLPVASIPFGYTEFCKENNIPYGNLNTPKTRFIATGHTLAYRMWVARGNPDLIYAGEIKHDPLP